MALKPQETTRFTEVKATLDALYKPLMRVHGDVEMGKAASEELKRLAEGGKVKGGLL